LTKNGKPLSKDFRFLGSRPKITPSIERCGGCPNCWSWRYYPQVSFYTNFSSLQLGAKASSWKHLAIGEVLIKPPWKGFFGIRLRWTRGDRKFPQVHGNKMSNWPQYESKAQWKAPIKRRRREKSKVKSKRVMPNKIYGDEIYLGSLILICHWRFELWGRMTKGLDLDGGSDGLRGERIGVEQI
jgi:hypothetical protein